MKNRDVIRSLLSAMPGEVRQYRELDALLRQQYQLMGIHQTEALAALREQEMPLLAELRHHAFRRSHLLKVLGFSADGEGMLAFLQRLPPALRAQAMPLWHQMQQLFVRCHTQNEINGRLLAAQRETLQRLLFGEPDRDYAALQHLSPRG